jgi:uncharacterized protein (DUF2235 family)
MGKTIIFCADGTWNGPGQGDTDEDNPNATNVLKLYDRLAGVPTVETLRLRDEQEKWVTDDMGAVLQMAKYLHGVGDSSNRLVQLLGGTLGAGIITRIVRGYTFISRNWQDGDKIFLTGFSRGAYTARALGGLIAKMGLLDATTTDLNDKDAAYRAGSAVWFRYRQSAGGGRTGWLDRLDAMVGDLPAFLSRPPQIACVTGVKIAAIGVWDTVGSLGIPAYLRPAEEADPFRFADTALSPMVELGYHAVAVDEERADFQPTLWDADPRIEQMLFAGAHSDVGGGYPPSDVPGGLADCGLAYMMQRFDALGVAFAKPAPTGNPLGVAHKPWQYGVFAALPHGPRRFADGVLAFSPSLRQRIAAGVAMGEPGAAPEAYSPASLTGYLPPAV